jgi:hypothetical protein
MALSIAFMLGFFAIGVLFMRTAVGGRIKSKQAQSWPVVKGRVVTSEVVEDRYRDPTGKATIAFVPNVVYEYNVEGQTYSSRNVIFGQTNYDYLVASRICEKFAVDATPDVYYNPAKPAESVLVPKSTEGMRSLVPGIFFIVAGILIGLVAILFPEE